MNTQNQTPEKFLAGLKSDARIRKDFVGDTLNQGATEAIFYFAVQQYKIAPTKKKARTIYELFCKKDAEFEVNMANNGGSSTSKLESIYMELKIAMEQISLNRVIARQMDFLTKKFTSSNRIPPAHIFDKVLACVWADLLNNLVSGYMNGLRISPTNAALSKKHFLAKTLGEAGFTLLSLGLS